MRSWMASGCSTGAAWLAPRKMKFGISEGMVVAQRWMGDCDLPRHMNAGRICLR